MVCAPEDVILFLKVLGTTAPLRCASSAPKEALKCHALHSLIEGKLKETASAATPPG